MGYPLETTEPLRRQLIDLGVRDLRTPEEVDTLLRDEKGSVLLFALGSSPTSATAPPFAEAPANVACRNASLALSRPGALPYQMPTMPS